MNKEFQLWSQVQQQTLNRIYFYSIPLKLIYQLRCHPKLLYFFILSHVFFINIIDIVNNIIKFWTNCMSLTIRAIWKIEFFIILLHFPLVPYLCFQIYFKIYNIKYIYMDCNKLLMVSRIKGNIPLTITFPSWFFCRSLRFSYRGTYLYAISFMLHICGWHFSINLSHCLSSTSYFSLRL